MKFSLLQRLLRRSNHQPVADVTLPRLSEARIRNRIAADFAADPTLCTMSLLQVASQQQTRILPTVTMHSDMTIAEQARPWWQYDTVKDNARTLVLETV